MKKIRTKILSAAQARAFEELAGLCRVHDGISLSCPLDADRFYLLAEETPDGGLLLISAAAVFEEDGLWECYGFTRPDSRRRGYFSSLLPLLEKEAAAMEPEPDLCFVADPSGKDALKALAALGAQPWYEEHAMEWRAEKSGAVRPVPPAGELPSLELAGAPDSADSRRLNFIARTPGGQAVGSFSLYLTPPSACLFEVEIAEPLRRRGLGEAMLRKLQSLTPDLGLNSLTLQVSGKNLPALGLYEKTGFRIAETLSYYLY